MNSKKTDRPFILGVGLGRTGTSSLQLAFQDVLNLGKCYHMREVLKPSGSAVSHKKYWTQAMTTTDPVDYTKVFANYTATVDFPAAWFYKDILKQYPNAKVILSIRDSPEAWAKSCQTAFGPHRQTVNTIGMKFICRFFPFLLGMSYDTWPFMNALFFGKLSTELGWDENIQNFDANHMCKYYLDWIKEIKANVPKNQLLIFNVKEGWKPLCEFLEVDVPEVEFPRTNDATMMKKAANISWYASHFWFVVIVGAVVGGWCVLASRIFSKVTPNF